MPESWEELGANWDPFEGEETSELVDPGANWDSFESELRRWELPVVFLNGFDPVSDPDFNCGRGSDGLSLVVRSDPAGRDARKFVEALSKTDPVAAEQHGDSLLARFKTANGVQRGMAIRSTDTARVLYLRVLNPADFSRFVGEAVRRNAIDVNTGRMPSDLAEEIIDRIGVKRVLDDDGIDL